MDKLVFDSLHIRNKPSENPGSYNVDGGQYISEPNNVKSIILHGLTDYCHCELADLPSELELIVAI